jgi:CRP-like cAMP-binding protein
VDDGFGRAGPQGHRSSTLCLYRLSATTGNSSKIKAFTQKKPANRLISRQRILKLLAGSDHIALVGLFERLNTFWGSVVHRYASLMTLSYRERLEAMLAEVGARFGVKEARGTLLTLELGHDDWAEMIGSSRPMVSRLIAEMVQNRVLAREGKHYILLADGASEKPALSMPRIEAGSMSAVPARKNGTIVRSDRFSS